jgi:hypothetical protein
MLVALTGKGGRRRILAKFVPIWYAYYYVDTGLLNQLVFVSSTQVVEAVRYWYLRHLRVHYRSVVSAFQRLSSAHTFYADNLFGGQDVFIIFWIRRLHFL